MYRVPTLFHKILFTSLLTGLLFAAVGAYAQTAGDVNPITNPLGEGSTFLTIIKNISKFVAAAVFVIAVIMLLYSAFLFITQSGGEDGATKARNYLIYALVGIAIALLAGNATTIIGSITGSTTFTNCGVQTGANPQQ